MEQDVAFVEDHVSVVDPPADIVVGVTVTVVAPGFGTVTTTDAYVTHEG
jgi:hypothetical protein